MGQQGKPMGPADGRMARMPGIPAARYGGGNARGMPEQADMHGMHFPPWDRRYWFGWTLRGVTKEGRVNVPKKEKKREKQKDVTCNPMVQSLGSNPPSHSIMELEHAMEVAVVAHSPHLTGHIAMQLHAMPHD